MRTCARAAAIGAAFLVAGAGTAAETFMSEPRGGLPYPDLVLPSIDDESTVSLSKFRGKKILLFHFASWRQGCRRR